MKRPFIQLNGIENFKGHGLMGFIHDVILFIGAIVVLFIITSSIKFVRYHWKKGKMIRKEQEEWKLLTKTTWGCPRCEKRVPNDLSRCGCGQAKHNAGRVQA